jgi:hypothetical protein
MDQYQKKTYEQLYELYDASTDAKEKELLKRVVEEKSIDDPTILDDTFQSYPEYTNPDFQQIIYQKQEFNANQLSLDSEDPCSSEFSIKGHQSFLQNFMTKESPYKSLLIYHGVGVGKTCTGITIAENFRDHYARKDRRILILSSKNIQIGWKKTIYSSDKGTDQCTGDKFARSDEREPLKQRDVNKLIKQYYELMAYQSFSNYVRKMIAKERARLPEDEKDLAAEVFIKREFSNRLMIIDEVHNIRDEQTNDNDMRDTVKTIEMVIRYSDNLRLILLTATPMYNRATEIIWILNMLLVNDKRPIIHKNDVFDSVGELTDDGRRGLQTTCRSYVSYLRGENPLTFPLRLTPSMLGEYPDYSKSQTRSVLHKSFYPKENMVGGKVTDKFQFLELFGSQLQGHQNRVYQRCIQNVKDSDPDMDLDIRGEKTSITDVISLTQLTNIAYPISKMKDSDIQQGDVDVQNFIGEKGLSRCMNKKHNTYSYKKDILQSYGPVFDQDHIHKYSAKLHSLLHILYKTEGIVFIYTNFISAGITPISLMLEQNGYKRYKSRNTLQDSHKRKPISYTGQRKDSTSKGEFVQAHYMVIDGSTSKHDLEEQLKVVNSNDNMNGEKVKIILGTVVASEGLDFKNIRSVHILDPWLHLNRVEQTIGRAIRFCSHARLRPEQKNVLLFLHTATLSDDKETVDTHIYRYAERKSIQVGEVENLLKIGAVDRYLYKDVNIIHKGDLRKVTMEPCLRGSPILSIEPHDKPYSKVCSWGTCDYNSSLRPIQVKHLNSDTYFEQYSSTIVDTIKKKISKLYLQMYVYDLESIMGLISEQAYYVDELIYSALNEMISQKYIIHDKTGSSGYLLNRVNYYVFQPFLLDDESIPLYYRMNVHEFPQRVSMLPPVTERNDECSCKPIYDESTIISLYETCRSRLTKSELAILSLVQSAYPQLTTNHLCIYNYLFDTFSFDEKCAILYGFFTKDYDLSGYDEHELFANILSSLVIYKEGDTYHFNGSSDKGELFGFVLSYKGKPCYVEYYEGAFAICNSVQLIAIKRSLQSYTKSKHYRTFSELARPWGYTTYHKKHQKNVFKVVETTQYVSYPPGPGVVCVDNNQRVNTDNLQRILQEHFPTIDISRTESSVKPLGKSDLCFILEIILRYKGDYIGYDKVWLKYY